ncbi:hypothetical protein [Amycolatopsis lexingtonensis]|uniref:hypothetical protein n=1 Tax=Amycolatopsis lexingtonensis TaxID=218822 RepID=UPI003F715A42
MTFPSGFQFVNPTVSRRRRRTLRSFVPAPGDLWPLLARPGRGIVSGEEVPAMHCERRDTAAGLP